MIFSTELRCKFLVPGPPPPHSPRSLLAHSLEVLLLAAMWALVLLGEVLIGVPPSHFIDEQIGGRKD